MTSCSTRHDARRCTKTLENNKTLARTAGSPLASGQLRGHILFGGERHVRPLGRIHIAAPKPVTASLRFFHMNPRSRLKSESPTLCPGPRPRGDLLTVQAHQGSVIVV